MPNNLNERVSGLEASLAALQGEMMTLQAAVTEGFRDLKNKADDSLRTNWSVILTGVIVVMSLYAAAVRPLQVDLDRQEAKAQTLAAGVVTQNETIGELEVSASILRSRLDALKSDLELIRTQGSPITDKRLAVIEYQLAQLRRE